MALEDRTDEQDVVVLLRVVIVNGLVVSLKLIFFIRFEVC